ncbi:MAG: molybdopterin-guanine dinucleotide biosynthesis protein B [Anaerolineae bacterium]|nr:molybdopterin-guanine dinucleotide biosynthesis protein B [Anaerolineae bacterium]
MTNIPVLSVVGTSGCGKTTLLEKLIPELKRRGYAVALVKHHPKPGLETDTPGKDTWRLARAGADHVALVTPDQVIHRRRWAQPPTLDQVLADIHHVDLILTEGYKQEHRPKIEVNRRAHQSHLISPREELVAIASDQPFDLDVPQFDLEDVAGLADWIERQFLA